MSSRIGEAGLTIPVRLLDFDLYAGQRLYEALAKFTFPAIFNVNPFR
jgi:hypothetical protein